MYSPLPHSQKPSESHHRLLGMSAQVSGKTRCTCASQLSQSASMWHARYAQQVLADCQRVSNLSVRQWFMHVHRSPRSLTHTHTHHSQPQAPSCLKDKKIWSDTFWPGHVYFIWLSPPSLTSYLSPYSLSYCNSPSLFVQYSSATLLFLA